MPRRILLVSLNRCTTPDPVFPLGLTYLGSALRRAGHQVEWLDVQIAASSAEALIESFQPDIVGISLRNIDDVLIRVREVYFPDVTEFCARVRRCSRALVVLGGSGFSVFPDRLLAASGADYGIQGEGELAFPALISAIENGSDPSLIPGVVHRQDTRVQAEPPQPAALSLPVLPSDRPDPLVAHYLKASGTLNVQTQRGCAHACCYCTYPVIEGHHNRRRPPDQIAEEFAQLARQGARYLFVVDSIFNSSEAHVVETCEAILRRRPSLSWGCFLRPQGLNADLMRLMKRAGLTHAEFGSDSFTDSVLQEYGKRFRFEDVLQADEAARVAGVERCHFLICGGPGETLETLEQTHAHASRLHGAVIMAVVGMRIYPGTALYRRALKEGRIDATTDLLQPTYYLATGLDPESIFARLQEFSRVTPNWIAGDPSPEYTRLVARLRERGVVGPLWSYFALLQKFRPLAQSASTQHSAPP
ncbi:MAG: cobalamin-dependent protein [Verrucomicrobiales bacterium]|nr:cobalamin-dependent protein [Verrucomicrobiales bacterium]